MTDLQKEKFNAVIAELKGDVNTIENANRVMNVKLKYVKNHSKINWWIFNDGFYEKIYGSGIYLFRCVFGIFTCNYDKEILIKKKRDRKTSNIECKHGIEIMCFKPNIQDGKYVYDCKNVTINSLKEICKYNGIKKNFKKKLDYINALIKC